MTNYVIAWCVSVPMQNLFFEPTVISSVTRQHKLGYTTISMVGALAVMDRWTRVACKVGLHVRQIVLKNFLYL